MMIAPHGKHIENCRTSKFRFWLMMIFSKCGMGYSIGVGEDRCKNSLAIIFIWEKDSEEDKKGRS